MYTSSYCHKFEAYNSTSCEIKSAFKIDYMSNIVLILNLQ